LSLALVTGNLVHAQAAQPSRTDVPVRNVVLFSSGVGYFEHAGTVRGDGTTELQFKTTQINDILKSLVLQDLDGGRVTTITYPSQDPLAKTLRSFQVDITANPSLADLLNQLRGAKVTIQFQAEKLSGTILGVEQRQKSNDKGGEPIQVPVLNVLTGAMIRAIELQSLSSLSLDDPQLQDELAKALSALNQARDQDKKSVLINFVGSGERRVRIGYVVETPIWKTSYRLLMGDKGANIQGWAIVENQTESDWNGVSLSLVSGRPISFMMDLYQPLYSTRPTVVPELFAGLRPQLYDNGIAGDRDRVEMSAKSAAPPGGGGGRGAVNRYNAPAAPLVEQGVMGTTTTITNELAMQRTVESMAQASKMGELFQYVVPNVTLSRQKSAMLPIITDSIAMDRLSIYNASVLRTNPLNGVRLKNTTGKHLLQGPITVLDKGGYAGDARIDNVPPGQERLLSYGIDLEMTVDNTKNTQTNAVVSGKINKGLLILDRRLVASQDYLVDNKGDRDKQIVIEHPIRQGWKLVDTQKPVETTQMLYRFQGAAVAKKVTTLTVKEEYVQSETIALLPTDVSQLIMYSRTGEIPVAVRDAIAKAVQLKQAVQDTERQIAAATQQINDITAEQGRIRENMKTVAQSTPYYTRLLTKLNEQETSIEKLRVDRDTLTARRDRQRKDLEDYLSTLTVG
jgi:hypothetical protein